MKNERPSKFSNIGEDVEGAARHRNDTYDENHEKAKKAKKEADLWKKNRKTEMMNNIALAGEDRTLIISEIKKFELDCFYHEFPQLVSTTDLSVLAGEIRSLRPVLDGSEFNPMAKAFNKINRKVHKLRYSDTDELKSYGQPKQKEAEFVEISGYHGEWRGETVERTSKDFAELCRAIQWGNSVSDKERSFVLGELHLALAELQKLGPTVIDVIRKTGFAFGARGRKGKLAHYEPDNKVLNINHGVFGALVHEIGHAIDGGKVQQVPRNVLQAYREKVHNDPEMSRKSSYYLKTCEIFARAFERYCIARGNDLNDSIRLNLKPFALFDTGTLPDSSPELIDWVEKVLWGTEK